MTNIIYWWGIWGTGWYPVRIRIARSSIDLKIKKGKSYEWIKREDLYLYLDDGYRKLWDLKVDN